MSVDEPPGRSWTRSALSILAMAGAGYPGGVILMLSLVSDEYNSVTQVASDYGVGEGLRRSIASSGIFRKTKE